MLAARILGYLRASEGRAALKAAMLGGGLTYLRAQAANALEMIGDVSTIPSLRKLTVDREWWVRLNASRALANMGPEGERALARVLEGADRYARENGPSPRWGSGA